jgi:hypothetical protein
MTTIARFGASRRDGLRLCGRWTSRSIVLVQFIFQVA